jgi:hypothetical protein
MTVEDMHRTAIGRCERAKRWLDRHRLIAELPTLIALIAVAAGLWRGENQADTSSDRDQARLYQRCEQQRPVVVAVNAGIALSPELLARVRREVPGELDEHNQLAVPDCVATYPRGARESYRFPDAAESTEGP